MARGGAGMVAGDILLGGDIIDAAKELQDVVKKTAEGTSGLRRQLDDLKRASGQIGRDEANTLNIRRKRLELAVAADRAAMAGMETRARVGRMVARQAGGIMGFSGARVGSMLGVPQELMSLGSMFANKLGNVPGAQKFGAAAMRFAPMAAKAAIPAALAVGGSMAATSAIERYYSGKSAEADYRGNIASIIGRYAKQKGTSLAEVEEMNRQMSKAEWVAGDSMKAPTVKAMLGDAIFGKSAETRGAMMKAGTLAASMYAQKAAGMEAGLSPEEMMKSGAAARAVEHQRTSEMRKNVFAYAGTWMRRSIQDLLTDGGATKADVYMAAYDLAERSFKGAQERERGQRELDERIKETRTGTAEYKAVLFHRRAQESALAAERSRSKMLAPTA